MRMALIALLAISSEVQAAEVAAHDGELYVQRQSGSTVFRLPLAPGIYQFTQPTVFSPLSIAGNDDGACVLWAGSLSCTWGSIRLPQYYNQIKVIGDGVVLQQPGGFTYVRGQRYSAYVGTFEKVDTTEQLFAPAFGCGVTNFGSVTCFDEFGSPVPSPAMMSISEVDVGTSPNMDIIAYRRNTGEVEVHNLVTGHWWQSIFTGLQAVDVSTDDGIVCASGIDGLWYDVWCYDLKTDRTLGNVWPHVSAAPPQIWVINNSLVTLDGAVIEIFQL